MAKQLLIIGNGFDLHCGLKSKYSDFFEAKIKGKYNSSSLRQLSYCPIHEVLQNYKPRDFWHTLLSNYDYKNDNYGWCDIENIIKETLNSIYKERLIDDVWFDSCEFIYRKNKENIQDYIQDDSRLAFIKQYLFYYFLILLTKDNYYYISNCPKQERDNLYSHLLTELNSLERLFCEYLKEEISKNDRDYRIKATNLLIELTDVELNPIKDLDAINKSPEYYFSDINILSFNYTTPFIHIDKKHLGACNHVHGKLCKNDCRECSSSTVIFGIDDKIVKTKDKVYNPNEYEDFRLFSKTYRTLFSDVNAISALPRNDNSPITIKFFGHSLNEADYSYFQSIFDYYSIYDNSNVSLVFYYTKFKEEAKQEVADSVYKLINQYGDTLSNEDQGKNLMHKLILEKRVKIKEIESLDKTV